MNSSYKHRHSVTINKMLSYIQINNGKIQNHHISVFATQKLVNSLVKKMLSE